jgi:alpha-aminoadipate/glutamate carrier protein LysW
MISCPVCKQKLMLTFTMLVGSLVVCPQCDTDLRIVSRDPDRVEAVPEEETLNAEGKPESYA